MNKLAMLCSLSLVMGAQEAGAMAGGLYQVHSSPFATYIARQPGDLLTVVVQESATTEDSGARTSSRDNSFRMALEQFFFPSFNISEGFTANEADGDPPGLRWNSNSAFNSSADNSSDHKFQTTIQVQIVEEVTEGHFVVRGHRTVKLNGKDKKIFVSGVVRQRDITRNNTIFSTQIADAMIEIDGEVANRDVRPGIFNRILNAIF